MKSLYLLINFGAIIIPFIFSFHPRLHFYKQWKHAWPAIFLPMLLFIPWDQLFTMWGVWGFNERYITGVRLMDLPLEELLFFICIPYACLFTYYCLHLFEREKKYSSNRHVFHYVLIGIFLIIATIFRHQAYTASTFLLLAIFLFICTFYFKGNLFHFYKVYGVLLIPFFIVNGLLTGTAIEEQVVWYNDQENIGLRLFTIPVEDVFYGMLLILMNVFIFELLRNKSLNAG